MSTAITVATTETSARKKEWERIVLIETQPESDWFVSATTARGKKVWYLRFRMTGWNPRLYGPFKSKHQCLLFLDDAINEIQDMQSEMDSVAAKRMVNEPCAKVWPPIIEYPVCSQGKAGAKKNSPHSSYRRSK